MTIQGIYITVPVPARLDTGSGRTNRRLWRDCLAEHLLTPYGGGSAAWLRRYVQRVAEALAPRGPPEAGQ